MGSSALFGTGASYTEVIAESEGEEGGGGDEDGGGEKKIKKSKGGGDKEKVC